MKLNELSEQDREDLMTEMRELIDKENMERDARSMYAIKKKELVDKSLQEITMVFGLRNNQDIGRAKDRFVHMTNYLYGLNKWTPKNQTGLTKIETQEDWSLFEGICVKVRECMLGCFKRR